MNNPAPEPRPEAEAAPTSAALFSSGHEAEKEGRFEEACEAYQKGLHGSPDQHPWHYRLGCVLMKMDRPDLAENSFLRALELEQGAAKYLTNLGVCLDRQGRRDALAHDIANR